MGFGAIDCRPDHAPQQQAESFKEYFHGSFVAELARWAAPSAYCQIYRHEQTHGGK